MSLRFSVQPARLSYKVTVKIPQVLIANTIVIGFSITLNWIKHSTAIVPGTVSFVTSKTAAQSRANMQSEEYCFL